LLQSDDDDVVIETFRLLSQIHQRRLLPGISVFQHLEVITHQLKTRSFDDLLIGKLTRLAGTTFPELFKLLTYVAIPRGSDIFVVIFEELRPSEHFCRDRMWSIWALFGAVLYDNSHVFAFLIQCAPTEWPAMFSLIRRMAEVKGRWPEFFQYKFLKALTDCLLAGKVDLNDDYFRLIWFFVFFRLGRTHNAALLAMANEKEEGNKMMDLETDYVDQWQEFIDQQPSVLGSLHPDNVIESTVIDFFFVDYDKCLFGLRFDKEGNWLDVGLAKGVLQLYRRSLKEEFSPVIFALASFLTNVGESAFAVDTIVDFGEAFLKQHPDLCALVVLKTRERVDLSGLVTLEEFARTPQPDFLNLGNSLIRSYHDYILEVISTATPFYRHSIVDLKRIARVEVEKMNQRIEEHRAEADKEWKLLWSHLTSENAPWCFEQTTVRYRRDFTPTVCFCPFRTKVNRRFDDHRLASELRDSGRPVRLSSHADSPPVLLEEDDESLNSVVVFRQECQRLRLRGMTPTTFALTFNEMIIGNTRHPLSDIEYVFWRRIYFLPTGIEVFFKSNKSVLLDLAPHTSKEIVRLIRRRRVPKTAILQTTTFAEFVKELDLSRRWTNGELSNFEFLIWLNLAAGRSFNNPSQYPIIPWVYVDCQAEKLDLTNAANFRDLTKPLGALNLERLNDLRAQVKDLIQFGVSPYLYSAYCSFPLSVFLFLVRMEPFTAMHIEIQGGRFDNPQRIFASIPITLHSVMTQLNDYRELIPEFFFEPEFMVNLNGFDLGVADQGAIDNVELPKWARDPMEYVYLHRKALESRHVTSSLNHWIDLIFGCKQRGEAAKEAFNDYKCEMYDDIWSKEEFPSCERRREIESTIDQIGQVPPQLFTLPHPCRPPESGKTDSLTQHVVLHLNFECKTASFCDEKDQIIVLGSNFEGRRLHLLFGQEPVRVQYDDLAPRSSLPHDLDNFVKLSEGTFAALCNRRLEAVLIDAENSFEYTKVAMNRQKITAISAGEMLLSLSSADARTHIFELVGGRLNEKFGIPTYRNSIVCSCISRRFRVVVIGTDDRCLVVGSLCDSSTIRVIHLDDVPRRVIITPSWGFIVVHGTNFVGGKKVSTLSVFNINGWRIRTIPLTSVVERWVTWASPKGFDFIVMSLEHGKLYAFEVFFLDLGPPVHRCYGDLVSLDFSKKANMIVAVAQDGTIHLVPFLSESVEKYGQ
jgi:hypothetical protein